MSTLRKSKIKEFDTVGRLLLLNRFQKSIGKSGKIESFWYTICECGNTKVVRSCSISSKLTKSCGCLKIESAKKNQLKSVEFNTKYSKEDVNSKLYKVWRGILNRCHWISPKSKNYKIYRGKGIKVCNDWHDFHEFKKWSLENGYDEKLTIDRIDSDKDYHPDNCRFVTMRENLKNRKLYSGTMYWLFGNKHAIKKTS